ncbi:MAG TPA: M64 family metallopeptidase [Blastocatellia bacterium]|nr:M64 family metallopeptidase [Blastocatellia bacterium]
MTSNKQRWLAHSLLPLLLTCFTQMASGQTVVTLTNNGDPGNRVDLVIVSEGYTAGEMTKFANDVQNLITNFFIQEPYREYQRYFNVYRLEVASNESGADHPERRPPVVRDTAFDATYNCAGIQRLICVNSSRVDMVVAGVLGPAQRDLVVVLVNDPEYGGSGGAVPVASTHNEVVELLLHEQGHGFGLLTDEYGGPPPPACNASMEPAAANATRETARAMIKWTAWIDDNTPLPTPTGAAGTPGLYEGASYCDRGLFRPTFSSKMRTLGFPFEQINSEQIIRRIYNFVSPIESSSPTEGSFILDRGATRSFSVTTSQPFTHALDVTWKVDGVSKGSGPTFLLDTAPLSSGNHTVEVVVRDTTAMVRSDPMEALMESRTWNVTVLELRIPPRPTPRPRNRPVSRINRQ